LSNLTGHWFWYNGIVVEFNSTLELIQWNCCRV